MIAADLPPSSKIQGTIFLAAAEAMAMCRAASRGKRDRFLVSSDCHPQTIGVVRTRGTSMGMRVEVAAETDFAFGPDVAGVLLQYPNTLCPFEQRVIKAGLFRFT